MKLFPSVLNSVKVFQEIRRDIHAHPELRYEEFRTADLIAEKLTQWGIPVLRGLGGTGVVGIIQKGQANLAIGLRADMDALPMQEANLFAHASKHPGKMHACGHDGHTAMLLGAAYCLKHEAQFDGTVYLIFQPAEEGGAGAKRMIEDGLFEKCPMDAVYGLHNWPGMPVGTLAALKGPMMASSSVFDARIKGKGAHGAMPHLSVDPVMVAVQIVQSWQTIVSRNNNPVDPTVISVTQIHAGSTSNVIPEAAELNGTVRTFSLTALDRIEKRMSDIAEYTAQAFGASIEFDFKRFYPPLINHPEQAQFAINVAKELLGEDAVISSGEPSMAAEDFAFMLQEKPGCYVFLGNGEGDHREIGHGMGPCELHNSNYDFNDQLLPIGISYWVRLTEAALPASEFQDRG